MTLQHDSDAAARITQTDGRGNYRFDRLAPGDRYHVLVQKTGFVKTDAHALAAGEQQHDVTLVRGAAIEGRVTTDAGDPIQNATVAAMTVVGAARSPTVIREATTDDRGRFRLHSLAAGDYYLRVTYAGPSAMRIVAGPRPEPQQLFYPAAAAIETAKALTLAAAQEIRGIEIPLPPGPAVPDPNYQIDLGDGHDRDRSLGRIPTATIKGRVFAADSRKPLRNAVIRLVSVVAGGSGTGTFALTDRSGRFEVAHLPAGSYRLSASADGYLELSYGESRPGDGARPIDLAGSDVFANADLALPRVGAVEGTLFDEFGDPAPDIAVVAARPQFVAGRRRLVPLEGSTQRQVTDDQGHFRLFPLPPGDYRIVAEPGVFSDRDDVGGYAPTYYPGTDDSRTAAIVHVPLGGDASETSFALVAVKTVAVSGRVTNAEGQAVGGGLLVSVSDSLRRMDFAVGRGSATANGGFTLHNVPPGTYTIQAFERVGDGRNVRESPFGSTTVTVGDSNVTGVVVRTSVGHSLRGTIAVNDSAAAAPRPGDLLIVPTPVEFDSSSIVGFGVPPQDIHDDLSFEVRRLFGVRRVLVTFRSEGFALDKILLDGRDVTDAPIDFRERDVEGLQIVLTPRVSHVTGSIADDRGAPRVDYAVVVFSADSSHWMDRSRFVALGRPNQKGTFDIRGLPSDDYLAVATHEVSPTEYYDPEFLETLRAIATPFSLGDGESKTIALSVKKRPGA